MPSIWSEPILSDAARNSPRPSARGNRVRRRFLVVRIDHTRLYTAMLILLGLSTAFCIPLALLIWSLRQLQTSPPPTHLPDWAIPWLAAIWTGYLAAISATLWCRRFRPTVGRSLTRMLNYMLLATPPFGTAAGNIRLAKAGIKSLSGMSPEYCGRKLRGNSAPLHCNTLWRTDRTTSRTIFFLSQQKCPTKTSLRWALIFRTITNETNQLTSP